MTAFLFQASIDHYDLRTKPEVGATIWWPAQRYRSLMQPGRLVFFWLAGADEYRGLYGLGALASAPYQVADQFRTDVTFRCRLVSHVAAATVRADPALHDHPIFTVRVGSNFLLEDDQTRALIGHIAQEQRPELVDS